MHVKFNDLYRQHKEVEAELKAIFDDTLQNSKFIGGTHIADFETHFSEKFKVKHTVACGNGTDALHIALKALGIGPGDEVIVPAHTWISTSEVVASVGASVVFCDTDKDSCLLDTTKLEPLITSKTKCIIPVHLFGQAVDMEAVCNIAGKYGLKVVEDCAQAHLAEFNGQLVGTFGDIATFSFYPGKNLGAFGDAGAVCTNDSSLYDFMIRYARHGALVKGQHEFDGINSRMDTMQARILSIKLSNLETATEQRRTLAKAYDSAFAKAGVDYVSELPSNKHVYHLYVIRSERRDELAAFLKQAGIDTVVNYKTCLPYQDAYRSNIDDITQFDSSAYNQDRILSLPIFPMMTDAELQYVVEKVVEFESNQ